MIETQDLSKKFTDFWAVDGISLNVHPGQILALLGQNGAGKTTTVRMLTALLLPTRGWARINGYDIATQGAEVRASVGVLTEQHGLYMRMSGIEYLDFFGDLYGLDGSARHAERRRLLDYFGLADAAHRRIGEYSKGMKQKLALARALIHNPSLVLADEPTASLDTERAFQVVETFAGLIHEQNRAGIMVTHDLRMCEFVDRVLLMQDGKLVNIYSTHDEIMDLARGGKH